MSESRQTDTHYALYVHVPFCIRKCPYCAFESCEIGLDGSEATRIAAYLEALETEAVCWAKREPYRRRYVKSLYLGGGTPSLLTSGQITRLVRILERCFTFTASAERTLEINPGTFDAEKAAAWRELGFNRASLGVQSLDRAILKRLGRIHDAGQSRQAYTVLREAGFENIGVDLIFGVQTARVARDQRKGRHQAISNLDDPICSTCIAEKHSYEALMKNYAAWKQTLEEVIAWRPEHVSCYGLTIEDGTPYAMATQKGNDAFQLEEELELRQYETAMDLLAEAGYEHYEVSNWARPGRRCVQNLSYWDGSSYMGLGPAAHSFEPDRYARRWNAQTLDNWLVTVARRGHGQGGEEVLSVRERFEEAVMLGLRLIEGVDESRLEELAGEAGASWPSPHVLLFEKEGFILRAKGKLRYSRKGLLIADVLETSISEGI